MKKFLAGMMLVAVIVTALPMSVYAQIQTVERSTWSETVNLNSSKRRQEEEQRQRMRIWQQQQSYEFERRRRAAEAERKRQQEAWRRQQQGY